MTGGEREAVVGYIGKVEKEWRSGQATEHSYRPMLKELVEALLPRVLVINEPKHIACGAPDYLIRRGTDILGFIEAKDLGDGDLDGRDAHKEQFDRYKDSLDTLCFTDYLDFRFYDHFDFVDSVRIAEVKGNRFAVREDTSVDARNELHDAIISNIVIYKAKGAELSGPGLSRVEDSTPFVDNKIALFLSAVNGVENREEVRGKSEEVVEPEDVFNYIYGVLHTPSYREKYREFLKIDFPRIPYPKNAAEFRRVAAIGAKLVKVHLLKDEVVTNPFANPYAKFAGAGDGMVTEVKVVGEGEQRKVYINKSQWFEPVSEEAWNFYIGGYQPAQKWLKDRKGRALSTDDQQHYRAIIAALVKTSALMKELDGLSSDFG